MVDYNYYFYHCMVVGFSPDLSNCKEDLWDYEIIDYLLYFDGIFMNFVSFISY
jgi:hypothetical protein